MIRFILRHSDDSQPSTSSCSGSNFMAGSVVSGQTPSFAAASSRPQLEPALPALCSVGETIDRQAQVGQHLVIDDIVKKHGIRVEGFLREDDAIVEWPVLADGDLPEIAEISL